MSNPNKIETHPRRGKGNRRTGKNAGRNRRGTFRGMKLSIPYAGGTLCIVRGKAKDVDGFINSKKVSPLESVAYGYNNAVVPVETAIIYFANAKFENEAQARQQKQNIPNDVLNAAFAAAAGYKGIAMPFTWVQSIGSGVVSDNNVVTGAFTKGTCSDKNIVNTAIAGLNRLFFGSEGYLKTKTDTVKTRTLRLLTPSDETPFTFYAKTDGIAQIPTILGQNEVFNAITNQGVAQANPNGNIAALSWSMIAKYLNRATDKASLEQAWKRDQVNGKVEGLSMGIESNVDTNVSTVILTMQGKQRHVPAVFYTNGNELQLVLNIEKATTDTGSYGTVLNVRPGYVAVHDKNGLGFTAKNAVPASMQSMFDWSAGLTKDGLQTVAQG